MDKETLSNYGWIVIAVLVLAVMIALATPFGSFVKNAVTSTTEGLFGVNKNALGAVGIQLNDQSFGNGNINEQEQHQMLLGAGQTVDGLSDAVFKSEAEYSKFKEVKVDGNVVDGANYSVTEGSTVITLNKEYIKTLDNNTHQLEIISEDGVATCDFIVLVQEQINHNGIIPEGGVYYVKGTSSSSKLGSYTSATTTLKAGDKFPSTVNNGDVYVYGDYEYRYNYEPGLKNQNFNLAWSLKSAQSGWGVMVLDYQQSEYETMLSEINGKPVVNLSKTFYTCENIQVAPVLSANATNMFKTFYSSSVVNVTTIPSTVKILDETFGHCSDLEAINIPYGVTELDSTFYNCDALITTPQIPASVTKMYGTFKECSNLVTATTIPDGVTNLQTTFEKCTSLKNVQNLPSNAKSLYNTFYGCTSLEIAPEIPNGITYLSSTFSDCTSLITAPAIPESVTQATYTFSGCTSLTGTIEINANILKESYYRNCFEDVDFEAQNLQLTGTGSLDTFGQTGLNYCNNCCGKCNGNHEDLPLVYNKTYRYQEEFEGETITWDVIFYEDGTMAECIPYDNYYSYYSIIVDGKYVYEDWDGGLNLLFKIREDGKALIWTNENGTMVFELVEKEMTAKIEYNKTYKMTFPDEAEGTYIIFYEDGSLKMWDDYGYISQEDAGSVTYYGNYCIIDYLEYYDVTNTRCCVFEDGTIGLVGWLFIPQG